MSTPVKNSSNKIPSLPVKIRMPRFLTRHRQNPDEDFGVHGGYPQYPRRNLLGDFNQTDSHGADFADDKSCFE